MLTTKALSLMHMWNNKLNKKLMTLSIIKFVFSYVMYKYVIRPVFGYNDKSFEWEQLLVWFCQYLQAHEASGITIWFYF
jgi:hypothetical protein